MSTVQVTGPCGIIEELGTNLSANDVRRHFKLYPEGDLVDQNREFVQNLHSGSPPFRLEANPARIPYIQIDRNGTAYANLDFVSSPKLSINLHELFHCLSYRQVYGTKEKGQAKMNEWMEKGQGKANEWKEGQGKASEWMEKGQGKANELKEKGQGKANEWKEKGAAEAYYLKEKGQVEAAGAADQLSRSASALKEKGQAKMNEWKEKGAEEATYLKEKGKEKVNEWKEKGAEEATYLKEKGKEKVNEWKEKGQEKVSGTLAELAKETDPHRNDKNQKRP